MSNNFWSRATLYKIPAHWWIPVCTQSQWSSQFCPKKKKRENTEHIVIFQCWFVSHAGKTPKIDLNLVSLYVEMKDFLRVGICTFPVCSVRRLVYLVLWFCLSCLCRCWYHVLAPCEASTLSLVLWAGAGAGGWMKFLLHRDGHFDFFDLWCYVQDEGHFGWNVHTETVYVWIYSTDIICWNRGREESGGFLGVRLECTQTYQSPLLSPGCLVSSWSFCFYFPKLCSSRMGSHALCCFLTDVNGTLFSWVNLINVSLFRGVFLRRNNTALLFISTTAADLASFQQPTFDSHSHVRRKKRNIAEMCICLHCRSY